jgi:RNA recognition motif-containing protein
LNFLEIYQTNTMTTATAMQTTNDHNNNNSDGNNNNEDVSTICVLGLPEDCTEREFRNVFAYAEGYDSSIIHQKQGCCVGFARFQKRDHATRALQQLNGYHFQEGATRPISATMANSQLDDVRLGKRRQNGQQKPKTLNNHLMNTGIHPTLHMPPTPLPMHYFHPAFPSQMPHIYSPPPALSPPAPVQASRNSQNSTIYLAGLPQDSKESDVLGIVSNMPEFHRISYSNRQGTHPLIFVKYHSPKGAKAAVEYLNNRVVYTSNGVQAQLSAAYAKKELK